jgi:hypothetical protein
MYSGKLASFCLCVKFIHLIRFILSIKRVHGDVTIQKIAVTIRTKRTAQLTNVQPIIGSASQVIAYRKVNTATKSKSKLIELILYVE